MEEYIKREDALDAVLFALVGTGVQSKAIYAIRGVETDDVVQRSEVEELQKQLDDYKRFVGEIRVTSENHAVIIDTEHTEYIDKRVAEGLKNMAIKQAEQKIARKILDEIEERISSMEYKANTPRKTIKVEELKEQVDWILHEVIPQMIAELKKKYAGE